MLLEKISSLRHSLALRLTIWYAGIFTLSSLAAFFIFYFLMSSVSQLRTDHELSNEIAEFSSFFASKDMDAVKALINIEAESNGVGKIFVRIVNMDGEVLASSNMSSWKNIGADMGALTRIAGGAGRVFETLTGQDHNVRVAYGEIGPGIIMQIGQSMKDDEEFIEISYKIFGITLVVLMVVAALIGWFMARRALRRVEDVTKTATEIAKGALELRVSAKDGGDEIDRLAQTFNMMLDRIHGLITGIREMTDNIAHDLRSPITRIRGIAEMTLTAAGSPDEHQDMAANTIEECDRLLEMINTMLDITEVEAGAGRLKMEKVDIAELVRDACELFQPIAEDKNITLICATPSALSVNGDIQRLQRVVSNLLDNALKYTPSLGTVTVSVNEKDNVVAVSVMDTGPGISKNDLPHIFTRFYRCDQSRSQEGTGLGLSLAKAIAEAHGGSISVSSSHGKGSAFTVVLPRHLHAR